MNNPEFHICKTCWHKWRHGQLGAHDCIGRVTAQRDEALAALNGMLAYFESGNGIATGRAIIKTDSLEVRAAYAAVAKGGAT